MIQSLHTEIKTITSNIFTNLFSWKSPERYWVRKERSWYVLYSFFFVVIIAILALLAEYILIIGVIAFVFLWFVQASIPPEIVEHNLTTLGIKSFGKLYKWQSIKSFWISKKEGIKFLNLDIMNESKPDSAFNKRITLLINEDQDSEIFFLLIKYLDYGNKDEVGFNILTHILYGMYIDIFNYLPRESELDGEVEPSFNELKDEEIKIVKPKINKTKPLKKSPSKKYKLGNDII